MFSAAHDPSSSQHSLSQQSQPQQQQHVRRSGALVAIGGGAMSSPASSASGAAAAPRSPVESALVKHEQSRIDETHAQSQQELNAFMQKTDMPSDPRQMLPASFLSTVSSSHELALGSAHRLAEQKGRHREECAKLARNFQAKLAQREKHAQRYLDIDASKTATTAISRQIQKDVETHAQIMETEQQITEAESALEAELAIVKNETRLTIMHLAGLKRFAREQAHRDLAMKVLAKNDPERHARLVSLRPQYVECVMKINECESAVIKTQEKIDAAEGAKAKRQADAKEKQEEQRKAVAQAERICTATFGTLVPLLRSRVIESADPVTCAHCEAPLKDSIPAINDRIVQQIIGKLPEELWQPIKDRADEQTQREQEEKDAAAAEERRKMQEEQEEQQILREQQEEEERLQEEEEQKQQQQQQQRQRQQRQQQQQQLEQQQEQEQEQDQDQEEQQEEDVDPLDADSADQQQQQQPQYPQLQYRPQPQRQQQQHQQQYLPLPVVAQSEQDESPLDGDDGYFQQDSFYDPAQYQHLYEQSPTDDSPGAGQGQAMGRGAAAYAAPQGLGASQYGQRESPHGGLQIPPRPLPSSQQRAPLFGSQGAHQPAARLGPPYGGSLSQRAYGGSSSQPISYGGSLSQPSLYAYRRSQ